MLLYGRASAYIFEWLFTITLVQKCKRPRGFTHLSMPPRPPSASAQTPLSFPISLSAGEGRGAVKRPANSWLLSGSVPAGSPSRCALWLEAGLRSSMSVPPAARQCRLYGQSCQVSSVLRGETCAYMLLAVQISFKLHNKAEREILLA